MKKRKVPKDLYKGMQNVEKDICRYETMERYVMHYLLEAGNSQVPVDDVFIKAGYRILNHSFFG